MRSGPASLQAAARYLRAFVFGVEDSLVSTVGLLSGIAIAAVPRDTIFMTGMILIIVEAFSMAVGMFVSEYSSDSYLHHSDASLRGSVIASVLMFVSYFSAGFVPLGPYLFLPSASALPFSVFLSCVALYALGAVSGRMARANVARSALRMLIIGGVAIGLGIAVGRMVSIF